MINKARKSYSFKRLIFQSLNVYPFRTFRYNDASKLGSYDSIMMKLKSLIYKLYFFANKKLKNEELNEGSLPKFDTYVTRQLPLNGERQFDPSVNQCIVRLPNVRKVCKILVGVISVISVISPW